MKNASLYVCSLLLAAPLVAQTTAHSLKTLTPVGVYAKQGSRVDFNSIAANTLVRPGGGSSVAAVLSNSHSTSMINWQIHNDGVVTASLGEQGGVAVRANEPAAVVGTSASPTSNFVQGPHAVLLTLRGRPGSSALVEAWATGGLNRSSRGIRGGYVLDVGNDRSAEFRADLIGHATTAFPVKFPASGVLEVMLQSEAEATQSDPGGFLYKSGMSFRFSPSPVAVAINYGESCGPKLAVKVGMAASGDYLFGMSYSGGTPDGRNILILGDRRVSIQIPGVRCPLLTRPMVVVPFKSDSRGGSRWQFQVPAVADINAQIQACDLAAAKASNGVHVICLK